MITAFDRIVIEVKELGSAVEEYTALLGGFNLGNDSALLSLGNVAIELTENRDRENATIVALVLQDSTLKPGDLKAIDNTIPGLTLLRTASTERPTEFPTGNTGICAVDHLVIQTADADECIRQFGEEGLGLRLALDQQVQKWGARMVFFRTGKMTLEVIQDLKAPPETDHFWGITYLCQDIDRTLVSLDEIGVDHSPIREGRKPGTRVATVNSHCLNLPTLLIGPA